MNKQQQYQAQIPSDLKRRIKKSIPPFFLFPSVIHLIRGRMNSPQDLNNPIKTTLFNGLYVENQNQRLLCMENLFSVIRQWINLLREQTAGDQIVLKPRNSLEQLNYDSNDDKMVSEDNKDKEIDNLRQQLSYHLMVILRMSTNCPFHDVRQNFQQFLKDLTDENINVPIPVHDSASFFIPAEKLIDLNVNNVEQRRIMEQAFVTNGRFSNVYRIMIYFPDYLDKFMATFNQILRLQGPLPRAWRNYIAIMASAEHQCQYLIQLQMNEFLHNKGDPNWLKGLNFAPQKLQDLAELNTLMAHQPWRIRKEHITALIKGNDAWSKSELVLAVVVMAKFHGLSSFVLGCGVVPDPDMFGGSYSDEPIQLNSLMYTDNYDDNNQDTLANTTQLMQRLTTKGQISDSGSEKAEVFEKLEEFETFPIEINQKPLVAEQFEKQSTEAFEDYKRFLGQKQLQHVDFDVKSPDYSIFRLQDYNWEEHGVSLIGKFLPELGEMLDNEFSSILNLTDYSLSNSKDELENEHVDTWPFRQAVWYYVLRLSGMCHDDYNYHEVNIYLNKRIKQYIKKVACYPENIVPSDFHNMGFHFRPDEKVHINLLASEARQCAELLYALIKIER